MRYPPQFLDRLRQQFRVSEVVGKRVTLKRHGREFHGLCPFHKEKTPSFTVNDEKGFYHCFGCHAHGDILKFVTETENIHFGEAVERLAREGGIALPQLTETERKQLSESDANYAVMEKATAWFEARLRDASANPAQQYIVGRGLTADTVSHFRMGFAPADREGLKKHLTQHDIPEKKMLELGLLTKPDNGTTYDKFRDRIMFPIFDLQGRVIAFGGRTMKKDTKAPKYLNSPDTPLFKKSYILYNANNARSVAHKAGRVLVAEGYMDVIALAQAGIAESVAPLGTAVTQEQLKLLWNMADEPILCLDGDAAGERAMIRTAELAVPLLQPLKSLRFCILPKGEDPDSLIKSQGTSAMREMLEKSLPLVDVIWQHHYVSSGAATPEQRAGAERAVMTLISNVEHQDVRQHYQQEMRNRVRAAVYDNSGNYNAGKKGSKRADVVNITPPPPQDSQARLITECCSIQMSVLLHYPSLFERGDIEELLLSMHSSDTQLMQLIQACIEEVLPAETLPKRDEVAKWFASDDVNTYVASIMTKAVRDVRTKRVVKGDELNDVHEALDLIVQLRSRMQNLLHENDQQQAIQRLVGQESMDHFLEVNEASRQRHIRHDFYGEDS